MKHNIVELSGKISKIQLFDGEKGQYGTLSLAVDDGYFKPAVQGQPNQSREYVERTYFHLLSVNENVMNSLYLAPMLGDDLILKGKLIAKKWDNQPHPVTMVEVQAVIKHTPKALTELGRQHGLIKPTKAQQAPNQSGFNSPQQGGFSPQQNGFNQPQQGGFQQKQSQNGFQKPMVGNQHQR